MYRFWVDVQEHLQVRHHQQLFCCEAEPACLVLDLHMHMYLVPAWIFQNVHDVSDPSDTAQFSPSVECYAALRIFSRYSNANFEITKEDLPEVLGAMTGRGESSETVGAVMFFGWIQE